MKSPFQEYTHTAISYGTKERVNWVWSAHAKVEPIICGIRYPERRSSISIRGKRRRHTKVTLADGSRQSQLRVLWVALSHKATAAYIRNTEPDEVYISNVIKLLLILSDNVYMNTLHRRHCDDDLCLLSLEKLSTLMTIWVTFKASFKQHSSSSHEPAPDDYVTVSVFRHYWENVLLIIT